MYIFFYSNRISNDIDPDARLCILENYWAYFFGFGLPYFLLFKFTPFFIGYGIYLALFPFCIMLGSINDYKLPFISNRFIIADETRNGNHKLHSSNNQSFTEVPNDSMNDYNPKKIGILYFPKIHIFQPARQVTLYLLKWFDEHIKLKRKQVVSSQSPTKRGYANKLQHDLSSSNKPE